MDYEHSDLENIVDQDEFLEPNLDLDILPGNIVFT